MPIEVPGEGNNLNDPTQFQSLSKSQLWTLKVLSHQVKSRLLVFEVTEAVDSDKLFGKVHNTLLHPATLPELKRALGTLDEEERQLVAQAATDCLKPGYKPIIRGKLEIDRNLLQEILETVNPPQPTN